MTDKVRPINWFGESFVIKNLSKVDQTNHQQIKHQNTLNFLPNGLQNRTKIDAKTLQASMPKLVTKKVMGIIKNHVSLNGEIIEIQCENKYV